MQAVVPEPLRQRCTAAVVEEGERVGVLAQEVDAGLTPAARRMDTVVPWVPAWTVRDLVAHLGAVHRWATGIVRAGTTDPPGPPAARAPRDGLLDWYAEGLTALVAALREVPPDSPAWHMSPAAGHRAADWARRQAHELLVHRMDLEAAAGVPHEPVDRVLAEDGVDELLAVVVPRWAHTPPLADARAVVAVHATDTGRAWTVALDRGRVRVEPGAREADAAVAGPAEQLLLHLWGRPAPVEVTGDPAAEALLRGR